MKIKHILLLFLGVELVLAALTAFLAFRLGGALDEVQSAQERRYQSYLLADELRQSSDDLTRFARTYAVTGNDRFERYFNQVLDIRDGRLSRPDHYQGIYWDLVVADLLPEPGSAEDEIASLENRMTGAGFTEDEFDKLREAQTLSDQLVELEDAAMNAVKGRFQDSSGRFSIEGEPNKELAAELLHGERYHINKANIMQPIRDFQSMVDARTTRALEQVNASVVRLQQGIFLAAAGMLVCLGVMVWTVQQRVIHRSNALVAAAGKIAEGDLSVRSGIAGADELGILGATFDSMVEQLSGTLSQAQADTKEAQSRLEVIFHNATDGIFTISQETLAIETVNPAGATMFGVQPPELLGQTITRFLEASLSVDEEELESLAAVRQWLDRIAKSGDFVEVSGRHRDGSMFPGEFVVSEAQVGDRSVYVGTLRDISQWKHLVDERTAEIGRLSTPVIEVWEGVLLLPLIGTVDSARANGVVAAVLDGINKGNSRSFILDISGVASIDTEVAGHLMKIAKATKLMGCEMILSGLSPEAAQTIVDLGIRLADIKTTATLKAALKIALR
jgi:PAS domain S-box-containing protein